MKTINCFFFGHNYVKDEAVSDNCGGDLFFFCSKCGLGFWKHLYSKIKTK